MANSEKKHINLVGGDAVSTSPSRRRKLQAKSKARRTAAVGQKKRRGSSRSTR